MSFFKLFHWKINNMAAFFNLLQKKIVSLPLKFFIKSEFYEKVLFNGKGVAFTYCCSMFFHSIFIIRTM